MRETDPAQAQDQRKRLRPLRYLPLLLFFVILAAIFRLFTASTNEMAPTLHQGDLVLAMPVPTWLFGKLQRGDLVLLPPHQYRDTFLRRIIGLPGETVELVNNKFIVEGEVIKDEPRGYLTYTVRGRPTRFRHHVETLRRDRGSLRHEFILLDAWRMPDRPGVKLGPDEYYLLADQRTGAADSRDYGPIKGEHLRRISAAILVPGYALLFSGLR